MEADEKRCAAYHRNWQKENPNVSLRCAFVTPSNVRRLLEDAFGGPEGTPLEEVEEIDVLQVDIDADDCAVAKAALEAFGPKNRPRAVLLETAGFPPPPLGFAAEHHPGLSCGSAKRQGRCVHLGCSLGYQVWMLQEFGYGLLGFDGTNALFFCLDLKGPRAFPADEFDCYHRTWIAPPVPGALLRRWFYGPGTQGGSSRVASLAPLPLFVGQGS